jgi:hypothetical protein
MKTFNIRIAGIDMPVQLVLDQLETVDHAALVATVKALANRIEDMELDAINSPVEPRITSLDAPEDSKAMVTVGFDLEAFKAGQNATDREGRTYRYMGIDVDVRYPIKACQFDDCGDGDEFCFTERGTYYMHVISNCDLIGMVVKM